MLPCVLVLVLLCMLSVVVSYWVGVHTRVGAVVIYGVVVAVVDRVVYIVVIVGGIVVDNVPRVCGADGGIIVVC